MRIPTRTRKKVAGALLLAGLTVGASCVLTAPTDRPQRRKRPSQADALTIFITGHTLGELKPCGCSGGQLGGFDRRAAVFNRIAAEKRLIIDTGSLVRSDAEQDLIKFNISIQAMSILGYNLVNLTDRDVEIGENLGLLDDPVIGLISAHATSRTIARVFQSEYLLNAEPVTVSVLTADVEASLIEQIRDGFGPGKPGRKKLNILIVNQCNDAVIASVAETGVVDCLICPAESDEPMVIGEPSRKPLVFSVGRFGRYVCRLQVEAARGQNELKPSFQAIAVREDLEQDAALVSLYEVYQQFVKEANLLEEHPRFVLPNGLEYTGSTSCKACHAYEHEKWSGKAHARAFATLERLGSNFDPECVVCHVVGMEYESGFISENKTPHLKDVGCENCHGPGSEHIVTQGTVKLAKPQSACIDCHTPEHSADYAGNERAFRQKIIHWKEPNAPGDVK